MFKTFLRAAYMVLSSSFPAANSVDGTSFAVRKKTEVGYDEVDHDISENVFKQV